MVKVYMTSWCPYCKKAKRLLTEKGVKYDEIDIEKIGMSRSELEKLTGGSTIPQIVVDETPIGGYDNLFAKVQSGELKFD